MLEVRTNNNEGLGKKSQGEWTTLLHEQSV